MNLYNFARGILRILLKFKGYQVIGLDNLPADGPVIIASNHVSMWDPVIVGCALPRKVFFMAKDVLFEKPLLKQLFSGLGAFPVHRGKGDITAIRTALKILKEGKVLGIFPEGTRSQSGELQEAMAGVGLIMEKSKAFVIPVKVYGSRGLLRQKRGNIKIIIGKPITVKDLSIPSDVDNHRSWLANEVMNIVSKM